MGRGTSGPCRLELSLVLDTRHRLGAWGNQTARLAVPDVDLLGLLGLSGLRSRSDFCFGIDIDPPGKAGSSSRRLRKHHMVHDPRSTGTRGSYYQLRLFYRLSLQLVRFFPLNYYWQIVALGLMGIVVMALIPQQSARTAIISQMLVNLSESLGYKNPSKASTGLFVASFLGLGQLGFLFLTGSTTSLIAWGLLPADVREQFTWGYWFLAALPPTLVVVIIVLASTMFLYRPESKAQVSYKMVQNQLDVLGSLITKRMDHAWGALFHRGWLVDHFLPWNRRRLDLPHFALRFNQHRRTRLGHVEERDRLGVAHLYGRDVKYTHSFKPGKN